MGVAACAGPDAALLHAGEKRWAKPDPRPAALARQILDRMWKLHRDGRGLSAPEPRPDYKRVFDFTVHVPPGWSGKMANGDAIKPGVRFLDHPLAIPRRSGVCHRSSRPTAAASRRSSVIIASGPRWKWLWPTPPPRNWTPASLPRPATRIGPGAGVAWWIWATARP